MAAIGFFVLLVGLWALVSWWGSGALQAGDSGQVLAAPPASRATTLVVTSTAESGYGTLRWAMLTAVTSDTITFDPLVFPPASPATIALTNSLPEITWGGLTIDGSNAGVILDGLWYSAPSGDQSRSLTVDDSSASGGKNGLQIISSYNVVRGLQILHFPGPGIRIFSGAHDNVIGGTGAGARNVIAGNGGGIWICRGNGSRPAYNNIVIGNYVGVDASGAVAHANSQHGIEIREGSTGNRIGGPWPGERNVISGNAQHGVSIVGGDVSDNVIIGNYIGTNAAGTASLGNRDAGINIEAPFNRIGGIHGGEGNLISGNANYGVRLAGASAHDNFVSGNLIGTDTAGSAGLGNGRMGVLVDSDATCNTIGGIRSPGPGMGLLGGGNLISGNQEHGVAIMGSGTMTNTVLGNYIGTDVSGTAALANAYDGIKIEAPSNLVGGGAHGEGNLISGNSDHGVRLTGGNAKNNVIKGNLIGTNASGTGAVGNRIGVLLADDAQYNTIGGAQAGERNVIAGNSDAGIDINIMKGGPAGHHNLIIGNYIGTDIGGAAALGNRVGVSVCWGAAENTIGGSAPGERNVIAGSGKSGIHLCNGAIRNRVVGNYLGTNASGTLGLANREGVAIQGGSQQNIVGPDNLIAYNTADGVWINNGTTLSNTITQNSIHSNGGPGIKNEDGGNGELPPPAIEAVTARNHLTGVACAGCTVEIFSDSQDEGRTYEGSAAADSAGHLSFGNPGGSFAGPHLTATATDAAGNTSEFSVPVAARHFVYSPLIRRR